MKTRKALSLIMALVMCLSLAIPAFAAEPSAPLEKVGNTQMSVETTTEDKVPVGVWLKANPDDYLYTQVISKASYTKYVVTVEPSNLPSNLALDVIVYGTNGLIYQCEDFLNGYNGWRNLVLEKGSTSVVMRIRGKTLFGNWDHNTYYIGLDHYSFT